MPVASAVVRRSRPRAGTARGRTPPRGRCRSRTERKRPRRPSCGQPWWPEALKRWSRSARSCSTRARGPAGAGRVAGRSSLGCGPATYGRRIPHRCAILTPMRTVVLFVVVIAVGAAIGIGLKQASSGDGGRRSRGAAADGAGDGGRRSPDRRPPLAALHAQANELLPGARRSAAPRARGGQGPPRRRERVGVVVRPVPDGDAGASSASRSAAAARSRSSA